MVELCCYVGLREGYTALFSRHSGSKARYAAFSSINTSMADRYISHVSDMGTLQRESSAKFFLIRPTRIINQLTALVHQYGSRHDHWQIALHVRTRLPRQIEAMLPALY